MNDPNLVTVEEDRPRTLTIRFCLAALLVTCLSVLGMTFGSYYQMRAQATSASLDEVVNTINTDVFAGKGINLLGQESQNLAAYWDPISKLPGVEQAAFYDSHMRLLWASDSRIILSSEERSQFQQVLEGSKLGQIVDRFDPEWTNLKGFFGDYGAPISGLVPIRDSRGRALGMLKLVRNYDTVLSSVEMASHRIFWYIVGGNLLLFFALFYNFSRGLQTIESQQQKLNQQISRLSNLLSINKNMQRSIRTASRRAVELNEQFLRRVGSDLHDGPAQSIGFAILRLDRVSEDDQSKQFNPDFHEVKQALDSALDEIRGISSGLVLPELEHMTLTQSLQQVVVRHSVNSSTQVSEYYQDLPDHIPLPIKICAYRFVQEGLNNAHRHGQAEKCRVTAHVKNDVLHLSLKDNGMGFRKSELTSEGGHLGLMGLKDRVESLGGDFTINSELGVGTAIKVSMALADAN